MADTTPIRLEREQGVATLTLCRPEQKNAMTPEWLAALQAHADALHEDPDVRVVLLRAQGPLFCVGADVKRMADHLDDLSAYIDSLIRPAHAALLRLVSVPAPVVCLLQGTAAGGGASLALACDFVVAARSARLVFAYPQLGTTPDFGLSHALIEKLGPQLALQRFLLSDTLSMDEAERIGLVQQVVEDERAEDAALALAGRLAALPSRAAKALFLHGRSDELAARLERERASFLRCSRTPAFRDQVTAFAGGGRRG